MSLITKIILDPLQMQNELITSHEIKKFASTLGRTKGRISTKQVSEFLLKKLKDSEDNFVPNVDPLLKNPDNFVNNCKTLPIDKKITNMYDFEEYYKEVLGGERYLTSGALNSETKEDDFSEMVYRLLNGSNKIKIIDHMLLGHNQYLRGKSIDLIKEIHDRFSATEIEIYTRLNKKFYREPKDIPPMEQDIRKLKEISKLHIYIPGSELHGRIISGDFGAIVLDRSIYFEPKEIQEWFLLNKNDCDRIFSFIRDLGVSKKVIEDVSIYLTNCRYMLNDCNSINQLLHFIVNN